MPTKSRLGALPLLAAYRAILNRGEACIESGIRVIRAVDFFQTGPHQIVPVLGDKSGQSPRIKLAARNAQPCGELLCRAEDTVRDRNGGLHAASITLVILTRNLECHCAASKLAGHGGENHPTKHEARATTLEPVQHIKPLSALEAKDGKIGAVHRQDSAQAALSREPDQRGVGEIDVPVRVLANDAREFRVRGDRYVHYGQTPFMDPSQEMLLGLRHQKKTRLNNGRRNRDQPAPEFLEENVRLMMQRIVRARVRDQEP